jgi:PIN domain nuclease of toxin-antitoxin system
VKLLFDTHTALWWINEYEKVCPKAKAMLLDKEHTLHLSMASAWEVAVKASTGKLRNSSGGVRVFLTKVEEMPISLLPITQRHLELLETLPFFHRDLFDRLLVVAAAKVGGMTTLTADGNIQKYDVPNAC